MTKISEKWISDPGTHAVFDMLEQNGAEALFVGGCVRNALLGAAVQDLDIATDAPPKMVLDFAGAAGLKAIPTGIEHGTITVVSENTAYEITTYRRDVETDGRRAVVAFSTDVADDARRRDFTMNALYATREGKVVDPLGGMTDLQSRRIRFIENADRRIKEDYLRSLRFFRFFAWFGDPEAGFDAEALAAISANLDGLKKLSAERVGSEIMKLLAAPDPSFAIAGMRSTGVLSTILEGADDKALAPLIHFESELEQSPQAIRRLAALGRCNAPQKLRLSKADGKYLDLLPSGVESLMTIAEIAYRHGSQLAIDVAMLRAALLETDLPPNVQAQAETGAAAKFPVSAKDLTPRYQGAELGKRLAALEKQWIESGFSQSKADLLR